MQRSILTLVMSSAVALALGTLTGCVVLTPGTAASGPDDTAQATHTEIVELPEEIRERGVLRMGSQLASPPLIFQAEGTTDVEGINKDIADEVGKRLGVSVSWSQFPFAGLIPAVQSGKVDAAMDVIGDTDERRQAVDFANYMNQATSPLVQRGNPHGVFSVGSPSRSCGVATKLTLPRRRMSVVWGRERPAFRSTSTTTRATRDCPCSRAEMRRFWEIRR